jgi:hypothetical protein
MLLEKHTADVASDDRDKGQGAHVLSLRRGLHLPFSLMFTIFKFYICNMIAQGAKKASSSVSHCTNKAWVEFVHRACFPRKVLAVSAEEQANQNTHIYSDDNQASHACAHALK